MASVSVKQDGNGRVSERVVSFKKGEATLEAVASAVSQAQLEMGDDTLVKVLGFMNGGLRDLRFIAAEPPA